MLDIFISDEYFDLQRTSDNVNKRIRINHNKNIILELLDAVQTKKFKNITYKDVCQHRNIQPDPATSLLELIKEGLVNEKVIPYTKDGEEKQFTVYEKNH